MMRSSRILTLALLAACLVSQARATEIKVCTVGEESYFYCRQMIEAFFGAEPEEDDDGRRKLMDGHLSWSCVLPGGETMPSSDDDGRRKLLQNQGSVLEMIENGDCNFGMDMDAHDVYDANKEFGWEAIAGEDYGAGEGLTYYGIAVVPTEVCEANPNVSLADFRGMRSCNTGYKRTSGWTIPLATIVAMDQEDLGMDLAGMTDYEVMLDFFPEQCTAGPPDDAPQEARDAMCQNCIGDCKRGEGEPYMGYVGSLRCLMEGAGDIGFMKQSTPLDYAADGNTPEDWATMNMADLKLVCPGGGCAAPEDYDSCNYARIPSHMVAAAGDLPIEEIKRAFMEQANTEDWQAWMANSRDSGLVNWRAVGYVPIEEDTMAYMGQLTNVYAILEELGFY